MDLPEDQTPKMVRKSLQGVYWESNPNYDYGTFHKQFYFFYGTLMDPSTLATVLGLGNRPQVFRAKVIGYHCMMWGQYPALLDDPPGAAVYGVAYEVQSQGDSKRLEEYETDNYATSSCLIEFEDGRKVIGRTFKWNADKSLLREGSFDLKDWQMNKLG
ncbi:hypothetical protein FQN54_001217 [Arachnomyces sp. PD_36]|nr:hypothetical protein FQN54_001217 [Arachnomyces sp. PD_36]